MPNCFTNDLKVVISKQHDTLTNSSHWRASEHKCTILIIFFTKGKVYSFKPKRKKAQDAPNPTAMLMKDQ